MTFYSVERVVMSGQERLRAVLSLHAWVSSGGEGNLPWLEKQERLFAL